MSKFVVDTNVAVVANGRDGAYEPSCRVSCIDQLQRIVEKARNRLVLDTQGEITEEYRRYLQPSGQPGVGDLFYRFVLNYRGNPKRIVQVDLQKDGSGDFSRFPKAPALRTFDPSDKKFVAAAVTSGAKILVAVDRGWKRHKTALKKAKVKVKSIC
jgi:hypothetical protein